MPKYTAQNFVHRTIGESYGPAMTITDPAEAAEYLEALTRSCLIMRFEQDDPITYEQAKAIQLQNLGYYAGYYDYATMAQVERVFGAIHPVFGPVGDVPVTPEEALQAGQDYAAEHTPAA